MSNSVYYKATDEDGNTVLRHSWKKHKYLYIKNGKYVYPEDVQKSSVPYKGPTSAMQEQNAPSTKVKKAANFAKKAATRDAIAKTVAARYLLDKASKSPTANAAKAKARSVVSKGEYKLERAGQKLARDVKKTGAYKKVRKATSTARDRAITSAEFRNKANSVKSKAEYKLGKAGQKLANDSKPYVSSAKKKLNSASKNANKAYKSAKKEFNSISKDANKAYKSAKKRVKKVNKSFNKAKRAGKVYLDYLTK